MKEKIYIGKSLAEIEALAVKELGVSKDDTKWTKPKWSNWKQNACVK